MRKGQEFFIIECQAGAGIDYRPADSMEEVERIVKQVLGRPTDNQVCDILKVQVVEKYTADIKIEPEPLYMEWKNVLTPSCSTSCCKKHGLHTVDNCPSVEVMCGDAAWCDVEECGHKVPHTPKTGCDSKAVCHGAATRTSVCVARPDNIPVSKRL